MNKFLIIFLSFLALAQISIVAMESFEYPFHHLNAAFQTALPLHYAAATGDKEQVLTLLRGNNDVNQQLDTGMKTPLHLAAMTGNHKIVQILLDHGANRKLKDTNRRTPLHQACLHGYKQVVELLLEPTTKINQQDRFGRSPLHLAITCASKEVVQLLVNVAHININIINSSGETPLHLAAHWDCVEIAKILIQHHANVDQQEYNGSPLHIATLYNRESMVKLLLQKNADLSLQDCQGRTALQLALMCGHLSIVELLQGWPLWKKQSRDAKVNFIHGRYCQNSPVQHLPTHVVQDILQYIQPESFSNKPW